MTLLCDGENTKPLRRIMMDFAERLGASTLKMEDRKSYHSEEIILPKHQKIWA